MTCPNDLFGLVLFSPNTTLRFPSSFQPSLPLSRPTFFFYVFYPFFFSLMAKMPSFIDHVAITSNVLSSQRENDSLDLIWALLYRDQLPRNGNKWLGIKFCRFQDKLISRPEPIAFPVQPSFCKLPHEIFSSLKCHLLPPLCGYMYKRKQPAQVSY